MPEAQRPREQRPVQHSVSAVHAVVGAEQPVGGAAPSVSLEPPSTIASHLPSSLQRLPFAQSSSLLQSAAAGLQSAAIAIAKRAEITHAARVTPASCHGVRQPGSAQQRKPCW